MNVRLSLFEPRQLGADEHGRALDHAAAIQEAAEEDGAQMQQQYQEDLDTSLPSSVYGDPVLSPRSRMSGDADDSAPAAIDYGQPLLQSVSVESAAAAGSTLQQKQDSMRLKSHPHYKKATRVADDVLHSVMLDGFFDALELLMERGWREHQQKEQQKEQQKGQEQGDQSVAAASAHLSGNRNRGLEGVRGNDDDDDDDDEDDDEQGPESQQRSARPGDTASVQLRAKPAGLRRHERNSRDDEPMDPHRMSVSVHTMPARATILPDSLEVLRHAAQQVQSVEEAADTAVTLLSLLTNGAAAGSSSTDHSRHSKEAAMRGTNTGADEGGPSAGDEKTDADLSELAELLAEELA